MIEKKLQDNGFSKYESQAYAILLQNGQLAAGEISRMAGIPQGKIYSVLDSLEKRGYCSVILGSVKNYRLVNPQVAFNELVNKQKASLKELEELQKELETTFMTQENASTEFFQVLTSKVGQVEKFDDLIRRTERNLFSFNKKPYATGFTRTLDEIKEAGRPLEDIIQSGARAQAIFEAETGSNRKPFIDMVSYYQEIGEEIRICESLPLKMLLIDGIVAMVSLRSNDASKFKLTSMVVEHTDLTNALEEIFMLYWAKSKTLAEYIAEEKLP
ncbi:MAG TPA: hypothetical protein DCR43_01510 [Bacteroidales bacterium]|nr:MAG: hypothetical protein A2X11_10745 [Bacteroidetes bacterium GWE2_42_24]OFY28154.1 MAG: hypothetical protein A2X09_01000 [Bacteroidetes bacterium GWF2_43_11]HAQ64527.1 hypothetical protein [Bacteroidales bacterium]HBZ65536.1 hypothetical protein [Bacteroidales bacterium]